MPDFWNSIFSNGTETTISMTNFLLCIGVSLLIGLLYCAAYSYRNHVSKSFQASLVFLPTVVCVVIIIKRNIHHPISL